VAPIRNGSFQYEDVTTMFSNIEVIHSFHVIFHSELEARIAVSTSGKEACLGDIFLKLVRKCWDEP
jgi:hypothetical protein